MRLEEYETLDGIIPELLFEDIEQLEDFVDDCQQHGADTTARYIADCIRQEQYPIKAKIALLLSEDFLGVADY